MSSDIKESRTSQPLGIPDKNKQTCPEAIFQEKDLEESKKDSTSAVLIHLKPKDKDTQLIPFNMSSAISNDNPDELRPLLKDNKEALHKQYGPSKETLLHIAIERNSPKVAVMLIDEYGVDPRSIKNGANKTPIELADFEASERSLKDNKSLDDGKEKKEKSEPAEEDSDVFSRMVSVWMKKDGFNIDKTYGKYQETLLHLAIQAGSTEAAKKLIAAGANVNAFSKSINNGNEELDALPLHFAFGHKPPLWEIIDLLSEKMTDVNQISFAGAPPLHKLIFTCSILQNDVQAFAVKIKKSHPSLEQLVLEAHDKLFISQAGTAEAISKLKQVSESLQDNESLKTELAILINNLEVTSEGLNTKLPSFLAKADIETRDKYGTTSLVYAAQKGIFQLVDIFIQHKAEITPKEIKKTKHTKTTLQWAMQSKTPIPEHLLNAFIGADDTNIHKKDPKTQESAFSAAVAKGDVELVNKLYGKTSPENQAMLISNRYRTEQATLLHIAVGSRNPQMVQYILKICGTSLREEPNANGITPLQLALNSSDTETTKILKPPTPTNTGAIVLALGMLATPQLSYLAFLAISDQPSAAMNFLKSPTGIATSSVEIVALLLLVTALYKWSKEGEHKHLGKLAIGVGLAATADLIYLGCLAGADKPLAALEFAKSTNGVWTTSAEVAVLLVLALTVYAWHKNKKVGKEEVSQDKGEEQAPLIKGPNSTSELTS